MLIKISEKELNAFVEDIVSCFASADYGWTGLVFEEEEIKEVIRKYAETESKEDNELIPSKLS